MTHRRFQSRLAIVLVGAAGLASAADAPRLPLDAGTYVVASYSPCKEAPLAGVLEFDGRSFLGPHASDCTSAVLDRKDATYRVETTCRASGDGAPATPHKEVTVVRVESRTAFVLTHDRADVGYALCPAFH